METLLLLSPKTLNKISKTIKNLEKKFNKLNAPVIISQFLLSLSGENDKITLSSDDVEHDLMKMVKKDFKVSEDGSSI